MRPSPLPSPAARLVWPMRLCLLLVIAGLASVTDASLQSAKPPSQSSKDSQTTGQYDVSYEPEFDAFDRSLLGRAPAGVVALENNNPQQLNLDPGKTACYMVEKASIFGQTTKQSRDVDSNSPIGHSPNPMHNVIRRADTTKKIYISANTCLQPFVTNEKGNSTHPQLSIQISTASDGQCPDSTQRSTDIHTVQFDDGAAMYSIDVSGDVYIGISAPNITDKFEGTYNFEVAVSFDSFYHSYDNVQRDELWWMGSDSSSAILHTKPLTENQDEAPRIMTQDPPFELFVVNRNSTALDGLQKSVCGLHNHAEISARRKGDGKLNHLVKTSMTRLGSGNWPKQQFYFFGLNASSEYSAILVKTSNATSKSKRDGVGGGGLVYRATEFPTQSDTTCKMVTDLEFCDQVQWPVPGNDKKYNNTELAKVYDDYAKEMYGHFETVIRQIPCKGPTEERWSLARTCDQCRVAYKRWLCTIVFPRCADLHGNSTHTIPRNMAQPFPNGTEVPEDEVRRLVTSPAYNTSRIAFIDETVEPGPYRELLPCEDVCYEVVQSCPAGIGFQCPQPGMVGFDETYAVRNDSSEDATCNYPGEPAKKASTAASTGPGALSLGAAVSLMMWLAL